MRQRDQWVTTSTAKKRGTEGIFFGLSFLISMTSCVLLCACLTLYVTTADTSSGSFASLVHTPTLTQEVTTTLAMSPTQVITVTVTVTSSQAVTATLTVTSTRRPVMPTVTSTPSRTPTTVPPGPTNALCSSPYVVKAGDTVLGIALRCGVTVEDIVRANGLTTTTSLRIGQKLVIPPGGRQVATQTPRVMPTFTPIPRSTQTPTSTPPPQIIPTSTDTPRPRASPTSTDTPTPQATLALTDTVTPQATLALTDTVTPQATSTETSTPTPGSQSSDECLIEVDVDDEKPEQNQDVSVRGVLFCYAQPVVEAEMQTDWHFKDGVERCNEGITDKEGVAVCTLNIGEAEAGFYVRIDVIIFEKGEAYYASTGFTPQ